MAYARQISTAKEREALCRRSYELHLSGLNDTEIADSLHLELFQATSFRRWWLENRVQQEIEENEARAKWRDRTELWLSRLDTAYQAGTVSIKDAVGAYKALAALGIDLDALAKAKTVNLNHQGSKVDAAIEELLGQFPAEVEEDLPI